jgi:hypothetical protein
VVHSLFIDVWNFSDSTSLLSQNAGQGRPHQIRYGTCGTCLSILLLERSCGGFHLRSGSCSGDHLADSSGNHFGMVKMNPVSAVARH